MMNFEIIEHKNHQIAEFHSDQILISELSDALDIIGNASYSGCEGIIMQEHNFIPEFFDLKTGVAGEVLQKFSTYNMRLAIIGDYMKYTSKSLKDFIYESNKQNRVFFVSTKEEALEKLSQ